MSELPISSPYRSTPDAPVTDGEREQLTTRLNDAYTDGRLEPEDYQARLDRLYAAKRLGELVAVVDGLPPLQTYAQPDLATVGSGTPGQLAPARTGNGITLVAVAGVAGLVLIVAILLLFLV